MANPITVHLEGGPGADEVLELENAPNNLVWEAEDGARHIYRPVFADPEQRIAAYGWTGPAED